MIIVIIIQYYRYWKYYVSIIIIVIMHDNIIIILIIYLLINIMFSVQFWNILPTEYLDPLSFYKWTKVEMYSDNVFR